MTRILLACFIGISLGAALIATKIPSFRVLVDPGTPSLTFVSLFVGIWPTPDTPWNTVLQTALPGIIISGLQTLLAVWLGAALLHTLLPSLSATSVWSLGVLPGSLGIILAVRLSADISHLLGASAFPWILLVSAFAIASIAWALKAPIPTCSSLIVPLILFFLLLLFGVQSGALHITGDSSNIIHAAFAYPVLPRIPLHHGDLLWAIPTQLFAGGSPETTPHWLSALWIWHATGRLALVWATWLVVTSLLPPRRPRWERAALTAFLCLGAHTLIPWHSPLVFNSGSPPLFALHPDTWGAIALAWGAAARVRWPKQAALGGFSAPLVSISFLLGSAIAIVGSKLRSAPTALATYILFLVTLLPGLFPLIPSVVGFTLTLVLIIVALMILVQRIPIAQTITAMAILLAAFATSSLLTGGLFDPFPGEAGRALLQEARGLLLGPNGQIVPIFGLDAPGFAAPNPYCSHFAGAFCADAPQAFLRLGLPAVLLAIALWIRPPPQRASGLGASLVLAAVTMATGVLFVYWGYPAIEKTGFHPMASWLRTRLLEPGWMMALLLSIVLLARRISPQLSFVLAMIWTIAPMTQDQLPRQIFLNAQWLLFGP